MAHEAGDIVPPRRPGDIIPDPVLDDSTGPEALALLRRTEQLNNLHELWAQADAAVAADFPDSEPVLAYSGVVGYKGRSLDVFFDPATDTYAAYMGYCKPGTKVRRVVRCPDVTSLPSQTHEGNVDVMFQDPLESLGGKPLSLVMRLGTGLPAEIKFTTGGPLANRHEVSTLHAVVPTNSPSGYDEFDMRLEQSWAAQVHQGDGRPLRYGNCNFGMPGQEPATPSS